MVRTLQDRVSLILDLLAGGMKPAETMEEYDLAEKDILACIARGAKPALQESD